MATDAQNEANRKNAEKSTGPRTETGKSRTRFNATRHGLCSFVPITGDEEQTDKDGEQFRLLLADLREEHHPDGPTEDIFVFKMAEHHWMGQRASWLLAKHLTYNENPELDDNDRPIDNVKQVSLMLRYHTSADRGFIKNFNELRKLQKQRRLEEIGSVPQNVESQPEAAPRNPAEPPPLPPITMITPDNSRVVLKYVPATEEQIKKDVENYLARKLDKAA